MTRRLNFRLLLFSLAILFLVGLVFHLVHDYQMKRNADALLRQALEQQDPKKALPFFEHYLRYRPDDLQARVKYVLTLEKTGVPAGELRRLLERVLQRDPGQHQIRYRLVHCLIALHRFGEAGDEIQKLLPVWPDKAELEHMLGWCQEANGDYPAAIESFARAFAHDPHKLESYVLEAEVLENRLDRPEDALKAMDDMVKANPTSFRAFLLRARYQRKHQNLEAAAQDIRQALTLAPKEAEVLLAATDLAEARGQTEAARQYVEQGLALFPHNGALYKSLANLEFRAGHSKKAIACLRRGLEQLPDSPDLLVFLADLLIDQGDIKETTQLLTRLEEKGNVPALTTFLQARLAILNQRWSEAVVLLEKARADLPKISDWSVRLNYLLGMCYQQLGDPEQQVSSFQRALQQEPGWTLARFGLGTALLNAGRVLDALTELEQVRKAADAPPAVWSYLARARLQRNLRLPDNRRNWADVEQALDEAAKVTPAHTEILILRAEVLAAQKRYPEAAALLEHASQKQPKEVRLPCALADLHVRQGQFAKALAVLEQAQKQLGDRLELRLVRCRLWGVRGGGEASQALPALGNNLEAFSVVEQTRLLRELADTWFRLGHFATARQLWRHLAQRQPSDLSSRLLLFDLALQNRQSDEAKQLLAEIRAWEGEDGYRWRCAEVALTLLESPGDKRQLQQARQRLHELNRRQRQIAWVALLEARIDELEDRPDQAIAAYQRALELGHYRPRIAYRLVQLLNEQRRYVETEQTLRQMEELAPLDRDLARLGAEAAMATHRFARALELGRQAVSPDTRDFRDLLWLARLLHLARQDDQAEQALRRAVQQAGHTPDTWIALIAQLVWQGQRSQAEAVLQEAQKKLPAERAVLAVAHGQELLGQLDRAEETYRQALKARPDDFILLMNMADFLRRTDQPAKAVPFLQKLLEPASDAPAEHAAHARRLLALILGTDGNANHYQQAQALFPRPSTTPADIRVQAMIQGSQADQQRPAIARFEETLKRQAPTPEEELWLAQLYEAAGDLLRARELLQGLLATQPENPQFLARLGLVLVQQGELSEAKTTWQRLHKLEPDSPRTQTLKKTIAQASTSP